MHKILAILFISSLGLSQKAAALTVDALSIQHPTCRLDVQGNNATAIDLAAQMVRDKGYLVVKNKHEKKKTDLRLKMTATIKKDSQFPPCEILLELFKLKEKLYFFKATRKEPKTRQDSTYRCQLAAKSTLETLPHCVKIKSDD